MEPSDGQHAPEARRIAGALTLVVALATGACATGPAPAPEATVEVLGSGPAGDRAPAAQVSTEPGTVVVTGELAAPDPCRELGALVDAAGGGLVLRVTVRRRADAEMCAQVVTRYRYRASIMNLEARSYDVSVLHTYRDSGWPTDTVVSGREVRVP